MRGKAASRAGAALVIADAFLESPVGRQLRHTSGGGRGGSDASGGTGLDDAYALMFDDVGAEGTTAKGASAGRRAADGENEGDEEDEEDEVFAAGSAEALARDAVARRVAAQVEADREEAKRMYFQGTVLRTLV